MIQYLVINHFSLKPAETVIPNVGWMSLQGWDNLNTKEGNLEFKKEELKIFYGLELSMVKA